MGGARTLSCIVYGLLAVGALMATWSENLAYFAQFPDGGVVDLLSAAYANPAVASLSNDIQRHPTTSFFCASSL
jgi:Terpene cyclase DEP1